MNAARGDGSARPDIDRARLAFRRACEFDVAVRKPGNVSLASAGHRMVAQQFLTSAAVAAGPLFAPGARVGARIEGAVAATIAAVGTNTNLGIVLLCAPIARAVELAAVAPGEGSRPAATEYRAPALRAALVDVLVALDRDDAAAAFRAIALAHPGGLGSAPEADVHAPATVDLREAMRLAAHRDRIALQYTNGMAELFDLGLSAAVVPTSPLDAAAATPIAAVQRVYLAFLATAPDAHIVRKHGEALAHTVMKEAAPWLARARRGEHVDADPAFAAWDESLKRRAINPGTSADLTVATLLLASFLDVLQRTGG